MSFYQALCVRGVGPAYANLTLRTQHWLRIRKFDHAYVGRESEETLTALIKYKSSHLGPKTLTNVFST